MSNLVSLASACASFTYPKVFIPVGDVVISPHASVTGELEIRGLLVRWMKMNTRSRGISRVRKVGWECGVTVATAYWQAETLRGTLLLAIVTLALHNSPYANTNTTAVHYSCSHCQTFAPCSTGTRTVPLTPTRLRGSPLRVLAPLTNIHRQPTAPPLTAPLAAWDGRDSRKPH